MLWPTFSWIPNDRRHSTSFSAKYLPVCALVNLQKHPLFTWALGDEHEDVPDEIQNYVTDPSVLVPVGCDAKKR